MFKKRRGIKLSYNKQGLIYFACMNYDDMPEHIQQKILNLCKDVGREYAEVLFQVVTNSNETIRSLALKYNISETQLYYYRRRFYEEWEK